MSFMVEQVFEIYDSDSVSSHIRIAEDPDGLNCVQVSYLSENCSKHNVHFPAMPTEQARLVAKSILQIADYLDGMEKDYEN